MNPPKELVFVLVGSRKRVGKDTFSRLLVKHLQKQSRNVVTIAFADALKHEAQEMFDAIGLKANPFTEDAHEKEHIVRPLLIALGMARRAHDANYWVKQVHGFAGVCQDRPDFVNSPDKYLFVVVSDWRFPNELTYFRNEGIIVHGVDVDRPQIANTIPEEIENSPKCRELAETYVANAGGIEALEVAADYVVRNLERSFPRA